MATKTIKCAEISIPMDEILNRFPDSAFMIGPDEWTPHIGDWARMAVCPACEEQTLIPIDDYLCIMCRQDEY